jgi:uncharacterized membrane protein
MPQNQRDRLAYIDWLRGFACLAMFEVHAYDAWPSALARQSAVVGWSRFSGTLPAPLFIFLAGVSCAFVADRMDRKHASPRAIGTRTMKRGAQIFAFALLFRLQEYLLGLPRAQATDLLRVDILNLIGVSIVLLGVLCWFAQTPRARVAFAVVAALAIAMLAPLIWTSWRPSALPWYIESYFNGVHNLGAPQPWLFPIFPWAAFAFAGLAFGSLLFASNWKENPARLALLFGAGGAGLFLLSLALDHSRFHLYRAYDYWHTSPNFFLARVGIVLLLLFAAYAWCEWGLGQKSFSPLIQLGQTSLLVYWVHTELVYGRLSLLKKGAQSIEMTTLGFLAICVLMVGLSMLRIRTKGGLAAFWKRVFASQAIPPRTREAENG